MNKPGIARIVAVLVGGAVLFGLELGLGVQFYFAIPAGVLVYIVTRMTLGLVLGNAGGK
jgi:hypothetical protein